MKNKFLPIILFLVISLMLGAAPVSALAHTIDGDKAYVETKDFYLSATPATLTSSGWVDVEFVSKKYDSVDLVFSFSGVDGVETKFVQFQEEQEVTTYVDTPTIVYVYNNMTEEMDPVLSWIPVPTIEYVQGWSELTLEDIYTGKDGTWTKSPCKDKLTKGQLYTARVWVDIPISLEPIEGKYCIGLKPWDKTIAEADSMGLLDLLDPWYNSSWSARKSFELTGTAVGAQTDYQMELTVHYGAGADSGNDLYLNGACQTDFDDIRFTTSDGETLLDYWRKSYTDSSVATFWVEFDAISASPDTDDFYIYYGNAGASTTSSGDDTFIIFSDGTSLTGWTVKSVGLSVVAWEVDAGVFKATCPGADANGFLFSDTVAPDDYRMGMKMLGSDGLTEDNIQPGFGFYTSQSDSASYVRWVEYTDYDYWNFVLDANSTSGDPDHGFDLSDWHDWQVEKYDNDWELFVDGSSKVTAIEAIDYNYVAIKAYMPPAWWMKYDDFYLGKFVDPEPTWTDWGAEETLAPKVTTINATAITSITATLGGNTTDLSGGGNLDERGFEWDTDSGVPYTLNWTESGSFGVGEFTHGITDLPPSTTIYFRAKVHNTAGWGYGDEESFETLMSPPDAPGNLVLTALGGSSVGINWTKAVDTNADTTLVRGFSGGYPEDKEAGWLVYNSTGTYTTDSHGLSFDLENPYYRLWSYNGTAGFSTDYTEGSIGGESMFFMGILALGLVLFLASFKWRDILLSYSAALTWMAIGFWWILGGLANFNLDDLWVKILIFIPFILAFTVLLRLMNTEIRHEASGGAGGSRTTQSWTTRGATPKTRQVNRTVEYRKMLRKRLRR